MRLINAISLRNRKAPKMLVLLCCGVVAGCGGGGPTLAYVKGTVTRGGKPLTGVSVTFTNTDKNFSAAGLTNESGAFVLISQNGKAGALPGKNKVTLTVSTGGGAAMVNMSDPSSAEQMMKKRESGIQGGKKGAPAADKTPPTIPAEYSNPNKSPLEYEVKAGSNEFDIPIP